MSIPTLSFSGRFARVANTLLLLNHEGHQIELRRLRQELVVLALDVDQSTLVELHIVQPLAGTVPGAQLAHTKLREWTKVHARSFPRVRATGSEKQWLYYTCDVLNGEPLDAYLQRVGPLDPAHAFRLVGRLLDDLVFWMDSAVSIEQVSLHGLMVVLDHGARVSLRIADLGLDRQGQRSSELHAMQQIAVQVCRTLVHLLTGTTADREPSFGSLTCLSQNLRVILHDAMVEPDLVPPSLLQLRYQVMDAAAQWQGGTRNTSPPAPLSPLHGIVFPKDVHTLSQSLQGRAEVMPAAIKGFVQEATDPRNQSAGTLHWLPSQELLAMADLRTLPPAYARAAAEPHRWLVRVVDHAITGDGGWLLEEGTQGCSLAQVVSTRTRLSATETSEVLHQVAHAVRQLQRDHHVTALTPDQILLSSSTLQLPHEPWLEDSDLTVKLRLHLTGTQLVGHHWATHEELADPDRSAQAMHRALVYLAIFMLTGEEAEANPLLFPNHTPAALTDYLRACIDLCREGKAPGQLEFLSRFDKAAKPVNIIELNSLGDILGHDTARQRPLRVSLRLAPKSGEAMLRELARPPA